jgi:hypothetical protein
LIHGRRDRNSDDDDDELNDEDLGRSKSFAGSIKPVVTATIPETAVVVAVMAPKVQNPPLVIFGIVVNARIARCDNNDIIIIQSTTII